MYNSPIPFEKTSFGRAKFVYVRLCGKIPILMKFYYSPDGMITLHCDHRHKAGYKGKCIYTLGCITRPGYQLLIQLMYRLLRHGYTLSSNYFIGSESSRQRFMELCWRYICLIRICFQHERKCNFTLKRADLSLLCNDIM